MSPLLLEGDIYFKIRYNTMHGDTDFYWRVIINDTEYLVKSLVCNVPSFSESSYDTKAGAIKYHIAGRCRRFVIDELGQGVFA